MSEIRHFNLASGNPLSPETQLWRYVPLKTLLVYLSGKVFIPSISTLRKEDPFEAEFYYDNNPGEFSSALAAWYSNGEDILDWIFDSRFNEWHRKNVLDSQTNRRDLNHPWFPEHYFDFIRSTRYAWCWFAPKNGAESAAMWNTYGKDGVAIITTVERLTKALKKTDRNFEYGRMHYALADENGRVNNHEDLTPRNLDHDHEAILRPHFFKRAEYQSENEIRFVTADCERSGGGVTVDLPPQDWVEEVRLWPRLSPSESAALCGIIQSKLPAVKCNRSSMLKNVNQETISALAAEYYEIPWQASAGTDDNIPSELKDLWPPSTKF